MNKEAYISKKENGYPVLSESGKNLGGPYKTEAEAKNRLRQVEYSKHKKASEKDITAVVIKGNPVYLNRNKTLADNFYDNIKKHLEEQGVSVTFDPGEPYTSPNRADIWIGHSRGIDRLRFAPKRTQVLGLGLGKSKNQFDFDVITHPNDDSGDSPYHYIYTPEMKENVTDLVEKVKLKKSSNVLLQDTKYQKSHWKQTMKKIASLKNNVQLDSYQREAQDKIIHNDGQMLLDWKMGTGKTLGSIALFEKLKEHNKASKALVLTPASIKSNYAKEGIEKFTTSKPIVIDSEKNIEHTPHNSDYVVVSNELFRQHPEKIINHVNPDTLIIDEAHKYKDPSSTNYKTIMEMRPKFRNAILLTGTPMTNHPKEVISILDIVTNKKHKLGEPSQFNKKFIQTKTEKKGPLSFLGIGTKVTTEVPKNMDFFKKEYSKYVHSHSKEDPSMPDKKIINVDVPMSQEQKHLYNHIMNQYIPPDVRAKIRNNWPMTKREAQHIFSAIIQARQVSNSIEPFVNTLSLEQSAEKTPKIKQVLSDVDTHLKEHPNHKAILYTNIYRGGVDVLSAGLASKGIPHGVYVGTTHTPPKQREQAKNDYLSGKTRAIIVNQAGTEGLSLPGTTAHFSVDGHFNPAIIDQAEGRGIRKGSPVKEVKVYRYKSVMPENFFQKALGDNPLTRALRLTRDTSTDEWIYNIADKKRELNEAVMQAVQK